MRYLDYNSQSGNFHIYSHWKEWSHWYMNLGFICQFHISFELQFIFQVFFLFQFYPDFINHLNWKRSLKILMFYQSAEPGYTFTWFVLNLVSSRTRRKLKFPESQSNDLGGDWLFCTFENMPWRCVSTLAHSACVVEWYWRKRATPPTLSQAFKKMVSTALWSRAVFSF